MKIDIGQFDSLFDDVKAGGFENMSEEEINDFKNSDKYKQNAVKVRSIQDAKANYDGRTVQEILGLSRAYDRTAYKFNSIDCTTIDLFLFNDTVENSPKTQEIIEEGTAMLPTFQYLAEDIFLSLFKTDVNFVNPADMYMSTRLNANIIKVLVNTPEYIKLREVCKGKFTNSMYGTQIIAKNAIPVIRNVLSKIKDIEQKQEALDRLLQTEQEMDDIIENMNDDYDQIIESIARDEDDIVDELEDDIVQLEQQLDQLKQEAQQAGQFCDELIDDAEDGDMVVPVNNMLGNTMESVVTDVAQVNEIMAGWGMDDNGIRSKIPFGNKIKALERIRNSRRLLEYTKIIGRMCDAAITEQKKKAKHGAVVKSGVTVGNKIEDALPQEIAKLAHPVLKKEFYKQYEEHGIKQYSKESNSEKNKGPIIICCDVSGSMEQGHRETWAKAMVAAVLEIAQMQKRDFACINYSTFAYEPIIITPDNRNPQLILDAIEQFDGGGTNWQYPLEKAIWLIKDSKFKEADILFITDGDCRLNNQFVTKFNALKEEKEFRCLGVLINTGNRYRADRAEENMKPFCDTVTTISSIAELENAESETNKGIFGVL